MTYHKGDGTVSVAGREYGLRLTMGALAEISAGLSILGPAKLAACLRQLSRDQSRLLLRCLIRACDPDGPNDFTDVELAKSLPQICRVFEEAFREN